MRRTKSVENSSYDSSPQTAQSFGPSFITECSWCKNGSYDEIDLIEEMMTEEAKRKARKLGLHIRNRYDTPQCSLCDQKSYDLESILALIYNDPLDSKNIKSGHESNINESNINGNVKNGNVKNGNVKNGNVKNGNYINGNAKDGKSKGVNYKNENNNIEREHTIIQNESHKDNSDVSSKSYEEYDSCIGTDVTIMSVQNCIVPSDSTTDLAQELGNDQLHELIVTNLPDNNAQNKTHPGEIDKKNSNNKEETTNDNISQERIFKTNHDSRTKEEIRIDQDENDKVLDRKSQDKVLNNDDKNEQGNLECMDSQFSQDEESKKSTDMFGNQKLTLIVNQSQSVTSLESIKKFGAENKGANCLERDKGLDYFSYENPNSCASDTLHLKKSSMKPLKTHPSVVSLSNHAKKSPEPEYVNVRCVPGLHDDNERSQYNVNDPDLDHSSSVQITNYSVEDSCHSSSVSRSSFNNISESSSQNINKSENEKIDNSDYDTAQNFENHKYDYFIFANDDKCADKYTTNSIFPPSLFEKILHEHSSSFKINRYILNDDDKPVIIGNEGYPTLESVIKSALSSSTTQQTRESTRTNDSITTRDQADEVKDILRVAERRVLHQPLYSSPVQNIPNHVTRYVVSGNEKSAMMNNITSINDMKFNIIYDKLDKKGNNNLYQRNWFRLKDATMTCYNGKRFEISGESAPSEQEGDIIHPSDQNFYLTRKYVLDLKKCKLLIALNETMKSSFFKRMNCKRKKQMEFVDLSSKKLRQVFKYGKNYKIVVKNNEGNENSFIVPELEFALLCNEIFYFIRFDDPNLFLRWILAIELRQGKAIWPIP